MKRKKLEPKKVLPKRDPCCGSDEKIGPVASSLSLGQDFATTKNSNAIA
jgi:hypothetical protein